MWSLGYEQQCVSVTYAYLAKASNDLEDRWESEYEEGLEYDTEEQYGLEKPVLFVGQ